MPPSCPPAPSPERTAPWVRRAAGSGPSDDGRGPPRAPAERPPGWQAAAGQRLGPGAHGAAF
ncbi:MAG TPA: hypothetical protein EYG30_06385 [Planctomycetes bacterium]|nr:hypothetical protein [Planctomycetota bacterium]HIL51863.1 hypothetical protein [Planctomycetota bacterium]